MHVPDLLSHGLARHPDRACLVQDDRCLTFAEVDDRAARLAGALRSRGLQPGERVAILAENEPEYVEIQVAAQRAGLIMVPFNYRLTVAELGVLVADCAPSLLIHGYSYAEPASLLGVPTLHLGAAGHGESYEALLADAPAPLHRRAALLDAAAPSGIYYTSGTTGSPKGAVISNHALWARLNVFALEKGISSEDVALEPSPLYHVAAHGTFAFVYRGATVVLLRAFTAEGVASALVDHRATHVTLAPTMLARVTDVLSSRRISPRSLRLVTYGGSSIAPEQLRRSMEVLGCQFLQGYGLTEAVAASFLRPDDHDLERYPERLGSAGTDAVSYTTRVVDSKGVDVEPGVLGEILITGPGVMDAYWNAPEATAASLVDGWLHTGDLGYRSEDGYLYVTDRIKDVIITGGENVSSREVEDTLCSHSGVLEAAVVGVPHPDWGEAVHAVVVLRSGHHLEPSELLAHCRRHLAGYKVPKGIDVVDDLPKNPSGKILKRTVRERYKDAHRPEPSAT